VEPASPSLVSVRFSPAGRAHLFLLDVDAPAPSAGDVVVVRTESGAALASVETPSRELAARRPQPDPVSPLRVVRRATEADIVLRLKHEQREREQPFDGSRLIFYFTAEARVDFRELVRELAGRFRTRIEMRQIGVRDEAKMLGGYGSCGRPLCCSTWLTSFEPVSIKMAKQQDLSLNPSKLSGLCGRLKCCLRYELPNSKGVRGGGCGDEGGCDNPSGCGTGGCGSGCTRCG
jgi:cell fate regulator YaaT (PSP1 superfamily)